MCSRLTTAAVLGLCGAVVTFLIVGVTFVASFPHCDALYFGIEQPRTVILPDLYNLSSSEQISLLAGTYELSSEYRVQVTRDAALMFKLCIIKRFFTTVSACVNIGTDPENLWTCSPDRRPDCLPSAIVDRFFGLSLWYQEESTVMYKIVDIDSGAIYERTLTNTTTSLSDVWLGMIKCQPLLNLTWAVIAFGCLLIAICCLVCTVWCFWICCQRWKRKR